jgi:hypothetical protein
MHRITRRAVLAGAAAALIPPIGGFAAAEGSAPEPSSDPIFAAIERHRAAYVAEVALNDSDDDDAMSAACDVEMEALESLLTTAPTTLPGCVAVLRYIEEHSEQLDMRVVFGGYTGLANQNAILGVIARAIEALGGAHAS